MTKLTASDIRRGMNGRWAAPEWAIMWEVGQGTGAASGRYADAIMMSLWPSRGLELHGVEIKVSRSDWRRESADPTKAEAIARFCDRWWIHTSPGVVDDLSAVPPAWGLREFDGKAWRTLREAATLTPEPITRPFLAALLRRADDTMRRMVDDAAAEGRARLDAEAERERARYKKAVDDAVERRTAHLKTSADNLAAFEAALGDGAARVWADFSRIGKAARALADLSPWQAQALVKQLRDAASEVERIDSLSAHGDQP